MKKLIVFITLTTIVAFNVHSQLVLSGLLQDGTVSSGNTTGSPIFNTLGNEASFANLYVTTPNQGENAPFLNHGNGDAASINYTLTPGSYAFYFFCDGFPNNDFGHYGLTLFFDGNNSSAGIAAFSPSAVVTATPVPAGLSTLPLSGDYSQLIPASGSLSYAADGLTATLTAYGFDPNGTIFGGPIDRVGNLNDVPDSYPDGIGMFSLTVAPIPESNVFGLLTAAFGAIAAVRQLFRFRVTT